MSRYFDVDELLENMRRHKQHSVPFEYIKSLTPVHVAPVPKWISVKERLPEVEADILAYIGEGGFVVCWMTHDGYWQCPAYLMDKDDVTHWQPLPEPPKEEGENA